MPTSKFVFRGPDFLLFYREGYFEHKKNQRSRSRCRHLHQNTKQSQRQCQQVTDLLLSRPKMHTTVKHKKRKNFGTNPKFSFPQWWNILTKLPERCFKVNFRAQVTTICSFTSAQLILTFKISFLHTLKHSDFFFKLYTLQ